MKSMRNKAAEGLEVGDTFTVTRTFTQDDVTRFAELTRDYNPVHFDDRFVRVKQFKSRICHGLLVAGMATEIGGQIGWLASGMNFRFKKPVYCDDIITCTVTVTHIDEKGRAKAEGKFVNQDKVLVLEATILGVIPGKPEQEVLHAMLEEGDPTNGAREDEKN
jgi:3-hydroxybutyryl-CoA dehydratase